MKVILYCDYELNNIDVNNIRDYLSREINVPGLTVKNVFIECDGETLTDNQLKDGERFIFETHEKKRKPVKTHVDKIDTMYHDYDDIKNMPTL